MFRDWPPSSRNSGERGGDRNPGRTERDLLSARGRPVDQRRAGTRTPRKIDGWRSSSARHLDSPRHPTDNMPHVRAKPQTVRPDRTAMSGLRGTCLMVPWSTVAWVAGFVFLLGAAVDVILIHRARGWIYNAILSWWNRLDDYHIPDLPRVMAGTTLRAYYQVRGPTWISWRNLGLSVTVSFGLTTTAFVLGTMWDGLAVAHAFERYGPLSWPLFRPSYRPLSWPLA